jgi:hypothetical protein
MGHGHRIFLKVKLSPTQLRTVAERRFADAAALRDLKVNERANGTMYLAGFVIECLLKAKLLEKYPWLQNTSSPSGRSKHELHLWSLCYRSHDLDEILDKLPALTQRLVLIDQRGQSRLTENLKSICAQWTIFARYSPFTAMMSEAEKFLADVKELKEWLK